MRLIIVEDEKKLADSIKRGLVQQSYVVDVAYDSDEGLSMIESSDYDLIILDLMLPGKTDGIGITKQLREQKINTPILMLTAKSTTIDKAFGLNSGADDYLAKPFAFVELIARVRALLRRPQQTVSDVLVYKDIEVNVPNKTVKRRGKVIDLTAKEFSLLEYLVRYPETLHSKEKLLTEVWDYDSDVLPNTLEVYIGYLRKKIDSRTRDKNLINTKRGFGYYLGESI